MKETLYNISMTAAITGLSAYQLKLRREKQLPPAFIMRGVHVRYRQSDVEEFMLTHKKPPLGNKPVFVPKTYEEELKAKIKKYSKWSE